MVGLIRPVTALLLATAVMMLGGGLQSVLVPIRAQVEGYTDLQLGLVGAGYYAGLLIGCMVCPIVLARVGHIRTFAAFMAIATTTPLIHAIWTAPPVWVCLRVLNGACFAGLLLVIESWLASVSDEHSRGRILGSYTLVHLVVSTIGMQFMNFALPSGFELFSLVSILFVMAILPIALTSAIAPLVPAQPRLRLNWLYKISPAAVSTATLTGVTTGAFWMLTPLYAQKIGLSVSGIAAFAAIGVIGGAIVQWPVGSFSDRFGRREAIVALSAIAAMAGAALALTPAGYHVAAFALIALFGAANFPLYTLALAHGNDLVDKEHVVEVSSGLLLVFSFGAVIGPLVGSLAMAQFGYEALFVATAVTHALVVVIVSVRARFRPKLPMRYRDDFVLVPRTTPVIYELDPRGESAVDVQEPTPSAEELAASVPVAPASALADVGAAEPSAPGAVAQDMAAQASKDAGIVDPGVTPVVSPAVAKAADDPKPAEDARGS